MTERIEDLISDRALAQFDELSRKVDTNVQQFERLIAKAVEYNNALSQGTGGYKAFKNELQDVEASQKAVTKTMTDYINAKSKAAQIDLTAAKAQKEAALAAKAEAQARKENATAVEKEARATSAAAKATKESERASQQATTAKRQEEKAIEDALNDYLQLSKAYNDAALRAKNYALRLGEGHPVTVEAVKDAKAMYDVLYRLDRSVGQNQRNVGNYKSAFDGLGMSFTQVARELPSLTISTQQFLLAISNNLPMVFDQIGLARQEIAALRAEGKETPSLLQRIGASIISWQIGLSLAVTLLTAFGPKLIEWAKGLLDGSSATKEAAERQSRLNEELREGLQLTKDYDAATKRNFGTIDRGIQNELAYARARGASAKEVLEIERRLLAQRQEAASINFFDQTFGPREGEDFGAAKLDKLRTALQAAKVAYQNFLDRPTIAGQAIEFGSEDYKKEQERLKAAFDLQKILYEDQNAIVEEYYNANRDAAAKDLEIQKAIEDERVHFFADELKYRSDFLKELSSIDQLGYKQRVEARKQSAELDRAVLKGQYQDELIDAKNQPARIIEINRKYNFDRRKLAEELGRDLLDIQLTYDNRLLTARAKQLEEDAAINKQFAEDAKKREDAIEDAQEKRFQRRKNELEKSRDILIRANEEERNAKLKTARGDQERQKIEEEYNRKRAKVELDTNQLILKAMIELAEQKLKLANDPAVKAALEAQLANLKRQLAELGKLSIDIDTKEAQEKLSHLQEDIQRISQTIGNIAGAFSEISNIGFDRDKVKIEEETAAIDKRYQAEIQGIQASALSQEEKTRRLQEAEIIYNAKKEQQELKMKRLELDRAKVERAVTIQRIIADTAAAVVAALGAKPYSPLNIVLAASVGALGAAQLARVVATPLPAFAEGTTDAPGGLSLVGDAYRRELVVEPSGAAWLTPSVPTVMNVPRHSIVYPDARETLESGLAVDRSGQLVETVTDGWKQVQKGIKELTKAVKNAPRKEMRADHAGLTQLWKYGANYIKYIEDQTKF